MSISTLTFAQNYNQDVVYLKNGSIIRGVIIEQIPNKTIKIETPDRSLFVLEMDDIEKITKEADNRYANDRNNSRNYNRNNEGNYGGNWWQDKSYGYSNGYGMQTGYKGIVELGYQFGVGDYGMDRLKLNVINGYQINPYFSLGIGTGVRYYLDAEELLIPFFGDFRVNFMDNNISPYLSLGVGYSFDASDSFSSVGFLLNPTVGVSIKISNKSAINVGVGYEMQRVKGYDYYGDSSSENTGAIDLVVGISF